MDPKRKQEPEKPEAPKRRRGIPLQPGERFDPAILDHYITRLATLPKEELGEVVAFWAERLDSKNEGERGNAEEVLNALVEYSKKRRAQPATKEARVQGPRNPEYRPKGYSAKDLAGISITELKRRSDILKSIVNPSDRSVSMKLGWLDEELRRREAEEKDRARAVMRLWSVPGQLKAEAEDLAGQAAFAASRQARSERLVGAVASEPAAAILEGVFDPSILDHFKPGNIRVLNDEQLTVADGFWRPRMESVDPEMRALARGLMRRILAAKREWRGGESNPEVIRATEEEGEVEQVAPAAPGISAEMDDLLARMPEPGPVIDADFEDVLEPQPAVEAEVAPASPAASVLASEAPLAAEPIAGHSTSSAQEGRGGESRQLDAAEIETTLGRLRQVRRAESQPAQESGKKVGRWRTLIERAGELKRTVLESVGMFARMSPARKAGVGFALMTAAVAGTALVSEALYRINHPTDFHNRGQRPAYTATYEAPRFQTPPGVAKFVLFPEVAAQLPEGGLGSIVVPVAPMPAPIKPRQAEGPFASPAGEEASIVEAAPPIPPSPPVGELAGAAQASESPRPVDVASATEPAPSAVAAGAESAGEYVEAPAPERKPLAPFEYVASSSDTLWRILHAELGDAPGFKDLSPSQKDYAVSLLTRQMEKDPESYGIRSGNIDNVRSGDRIKLGIVHDANIQTAVVGAAKKLTAAQEANIAKYRAARQRGPAQSET